MGLSIQPPQGLLQGWDTFSAGAAPAGASKHPHRFPHISSGLSLPKPHFSVQIPGDNCICLWPLNTPEMGRTKPSVLRDQFVTPAPKTACTGMAKGKERSTWTQPGLRVPDTAHLPSSPHFQLQEASLQGHRCSSISSLALHFSWAIPSIAQPQHGPGTELLGEIAAVGH